MRFKKDLKNDNVRTFKYDHSLRKADETAEVDETAEEVPVSDENNSMDSVEDSSEAEQLSVEYVGDPTTDHPKNT